MYGRSRGKNCQREIRFKNTCSLSLVSFAFNIFEFYCDLLIVIKIIVTSNTKKYLFDNIIHLYCQILYLI